MSRQLISALATAAALTLAGAPAPAAAQQPCAGGYTVRTGDTLAAIAARCGTTVPALLSVNPGIQDQLDLTVGGRLRIPSPDARPSPVEACGGFYTLRTGDTLEEVAEKCGLTVPLLVAANPGAENPENVRPGGSIRIPDLPRPGTAFDPVVVAGAVADSVGAVADSAIAAVEPVPYLRVEGVLRNGDRCTILRTADGTEYGIAGGVGPGFDVGDRVVVTGPAADRGECGTARAMHVRIMWRPR